MEILLDKIGKRYGYEWIFKNVQLNFAANNIYGLKGPNGSGKSTLLRILSGHLSPSEGKITFKQEQKILSISDVYKHVSYTGPYIDLINQFTLKESIDFHFKFKSCELNSINEVITRMDLEKAKDKQLAFFSSGMKQRVKLGLSLLSKTEVLLIDEPSTNLDKNGIAWYQEMLSKYSKNKLIIVASNEEGDYQQASEVLDIMDYKLKKETLQK